MLWTRSRVGITAVAVLVTAIGGWLALPSGEKRTKPITVGTSDVVTSLDPAGAYDAGSWALYSNVFQSLLTFRPGGLTPVPDAARSCGFTGGGLTTYVCELRDDLTFAGGGSVTAADVEYSFERMLRIKSRLGPAPLFSTLESVSAKGQKVTFRLRTGDATFPQKLATGAGSIVDRTRYPADKLRTGTSVTGSGPYLLTTYKTGVRARLEPNPEYRGAIGSTGGPVEVRYFTTSEELAKGRRAGGLDVVHRQLPAAVLAKLDPSDAELRMTETRSPETRSLVFNLGSGSPMAERAVRRAIATTVDRGALADRVYRSTVQPLYSLIPQGILAHSNPFFDAHPEADTDRAREILQDAGVSTPVRFTLAHWADTGPTQEAAELKRQLEATGLFRIRLTSAEWTEYQRNFTQGAYDAFLVGWFPDFPDPDSFTQPLVGRNSTLHTGYRSDTVDRLIAATQRYEQRSRATLDFKKLQRKIAEDVPLLPLWQRTEYVLSTRDVGGSQYLTDGTGIWRLWSLTWL
ncbi:ABC transporter substrate-binding protein [Streptomyces yaizuensis]|uniref:ABC transporter substrate-binding protein n=1 Tax=Streptomyces yaizuensis TaxID=2989713 RepID=A0ABQ5P547_9ACTN|nr:ABC transporter substrate-binding protein [Streptomyces sp. YSPA8]GLF97694.1 ABC transporter substrate-binding protein [Streptomyces sp. YSPA8]